MTSNEQDDEDDDERNMAEDDRRWDGNWMTAGLNGMFASLDDDDFCENELDEFLEEKEKTAGKSSLQMEDEFLILPPEGADGWFRVHHEILQPRGLHAASGLIRRFVEGSCPPRIRIRKLDPEEIQELLSHKKLGNEAFSRKEYEEAVEHYDDALMLVMDLFVAPLDQVKEVVNVLSNKAECYLRLKRYSDAGDTATEALMFDGSHEKSRLRRAKAELAIAGAPHLIQAQRDLNEIVENKVSKAGVNEAKEYLEQLDELLRMERKALEDKKPDSDWDFYVRLLKSKCW